MLLTPAHKVHRPRNTQANHLTAEILVVIKTKQTFWPRVRSASSSNLQRLGARLIANLDDVTARTRRVKGCR